MKKKRIIPGPILMFVTILVITGFQVYWLKNNYDREKRSLEIRTNVHFQETVRRLQTAKLKLVDPFFNDSVPHGKMRVFINNDMPGGRGMDVKGLPREKIVTMVNSMRDKLNDSLKKRPGGNSAVILSLNKNSFSRFKKDSTPPGIEEKIESRGDRIFQYLYGVDSLQDSLKLPEITKAYSKELKDEKLDVPFSVLRLEDEKLNEEDPDMSEVTVGFAHPITYRLQLGNTFPYLLKKITLPILFSIFLVGVTVLSFLLLYRNILRQQKLAEIKNEFISNITHELKTPIATVGVAIEALKNFNAMHDLERTKEYLDISSNELQRLSLLVDKVLKLSMFEKKEMDLKKETFDMQGLINEVLNIMKLQFEKYRATVNVKTEGENFMIEADRLHITSVLYNLLDNALKYSGENPVIELSLSALPQDIIELKVKDNGIGIAKEYQRKIFDKFFRVPMGDRHNIKGYGLGLSYVSEILQQHMGFITVDSEVGKGTTFTIKLPRREADVIQFDEKRKIFKKEMKMGSKKDKQA